jgi:acyl-CoA thioester hydrolase
MAKGARAWFDMSRTVKSKIRIEPRFHQTDMMGVIHNVQYFYWFEEGLFRVMSRILPIEEAITRGIALPVISNSCSYKNFVRLGDPLVLETSHEILDTWEGKLSFRHTLVHEKKKIEMASGETITTIFDMRENQLVLRWPDDLWQRYQDLQ